MIFWKILILLTLDFKHFSIELKIMKIFSIEITKKKKKCIYNIHIINKFRCLYIMDKYNIF